MARTALDPYELPGDYASAGAEVLDQDDVTHGGPYYTGIGVNSMYRNYRGDLVHDGKVADLYPQAATLAPVLQTAAPTTAEYKPRLLGRSSFTSENVEVWFYVNAKTTPATGPWIMRLDCLAVATAATATINVTGTTLGWVRLLVAGKDLAIIDNAETEQFTCSFTVVSGGWDQTIVNAVHIFYPADSTALPACAAGDDGYPHSGFVPLDTAQFTGEAPRSAAAAMHLHRDLQYLDEQRVGNICGSGNMDEVTQQWDTIFSEVPPPGVTSAKFWIETSGIVSTTVAVRGGSGDTQSAGTVAGAFTAITVSVLPGVPCDFYISTGLSSIYLRSVSGYWEDA